MLGRAVATVHVIVHPAKDVLGRRSGALVIVVVRRLKAIDEAIDARLVEQPVDVPTLTLRARPPEHLTECAGRGGLTQLGARVEAVFLAFAKLEWKVEVAVRHNTFAPLSRPATSKVLLHLSRLAVQLDGFVAVQAVADRFICVAFGIVETVEHPYAVWLQELPRQVPQPVDRAVSPFSIGRVAPVRVLNVEPHKCQRLAGLPLLRDSFEYLARRVACAGKRGPPTTLSSTPSCRFPRHWRHGRGRP